MNVTVDTNILIRAVVQDDARQAKAASTLLREATTIAITLPVLCEFVWVLRSVYGFAAAELAAAIRSLLAASNVQVNRTSAEAGLAILEAGGDFADGVIAHEGKWLGGDVYASFDKKAVALLSAQGVLTRVL
jgi:predicted nucleic-acid-binding protein